MQHLRTFGELSVWREGERAPVKTVQRRSLAVLAILASSRSSGVSRERVVSILWPESDDESAKASLRQAVFATRRELGSDDVILGLNELSLNPALITSDVNQFASAMSAKNYERAAELYRGPFLDGVQVSHSAEFERWAESQRRVLSGEYEQALNELASLATRQAELTKAVEWWRKLASHDPLSSRYAAGLMEALIVAGDSGASLGHFRIHEALVREELSSAPDPAVSAIAKRARELGVAAASTPADAGRGHRSLEKTAVPHEETSGSTAPAPAPFAAIGSGVAAAEPIREVRSKRSLNKRGPALVGAALLGAGALMALAFLSAGRHEPESARRIVVAPFENRTGDHGLDALGAMTADWITDDLTRTGLINVVDPGTAFFAAKDAQERAGSASHSPAVVKAISLTSDADIVTTGDYFLKGDSLEFHAWISDARHDREIASMEPVTVAIGTPANAVEAVRQRILGILARELDPRLSEVIEQQSAPPTFDAYRAYTGGLQFFSRRDYDGAAIQFRRAYEIDPSFAAASIWASIMYTYDDKLDLARTLLDSLRPRRGRLTRLDQYALDAMSASSSGWIDSSIVAAKAAAAVAPRSQWVWFAAIWSVAANRPREAIPLFERIDPNRGWAKGWPDYWVQLSGAKHLVGDFRGERETIERGLQAAPSDKTLRLRLERNLAAQGRIQEVEARVNELLSSSDRTAVLQLATLLLELREHGHAADAERLFTRAVPYYKSKWSSTLAGRLGFANMLFDARRWREARIQYELTAPEARRQYEPQVRDSAGRYFGSYYVWILAHIGMCAAVLGDTTTAVAIADTLGRITGHEKPRAIFYEATVLASLRRNAEAVVLLRRSYAMGFWKLSVLGHSSRYMFPNLWGYRPFEEFFKPD